MIKMRQNSRKGKIFLVSSIILFFWWYILNIYTLFQHENIVQNKSVKFIVFSLLVIISKALQLILKLKNFYRFLRSLLDARFLCLEVYFLKLTNLIINYQVFFTINNKPKKHNLEIFQKHVTCSLFIFLDFWYWDLLNTLDPYNKNKFWKRTMRTPISILKIKMKILLKSKIRTN